MRIVIKVGTSTLTHATGNLNIRRVEELYKVLSDLKNAGHEPVLVQRVYVRKFAGRKARLLHELPELCHPLPALDVDRVLLLVERGVADIAHERTIIPLVEIILALESVLELRTHKEPRRLAMGTIRILLAHRPNLIRNLRGHLPAGRFKSVIRLRRERCGRRFHAALASDNKPTE